MKRLTDEEIHELAREMAIHLVGGVVNLNLFAAEAICSDDTGDAETWGLWESQARAEPHAAALSEFNPYLAHLCGATGAYGYEEAPQ